MKKIVSVLTAFSMVFLLAACGGGDATDGTTTGNVTTTTKADGTDAPDETDAPEETDAPDETDAPTEPTGGITAEITVQVEEDWMEYYQAAIERVKAANPDATITLIEVASFDHLDIIDNTDALNEDVADVFAIPADRLYGLHSNDILMPIDSKAVAAVVGGWDDFDAGIGGNFNIDGEYFAFPYNIETLILFANTANAETAGIDLAQKVELNDYNDNEILLPLFDAWYGVAATNASEIELLGKEDDGTLFSDTTLDWAELPAEKQASIEAMYDYWKKNYDANTSLFDADAGWAYIDNAFTTGSGSSVLRLGGPWDTLAISEQAGEGNLEILPISQVTLGGASLNHWQGGWGLALNARIEGDADKVALAEAVIAEIVNTDYAVDLFKAAGKILENVPADVYLNSDLSDTDKAVIEAVIASYAEAPARPLFQEWGSVWDTWKNGVLSWNTVVPADVEAAYAELQASFESMMANN